MRGQTMLCLVLLMGALGACSHVGTSEKTIPHLYVIGDSTASLYPADRYPRMGWAQVLQDYLYPSAVIVEDAAKSGRSAKSFYEEGHWASVVGALRRGDYVLIQFGHNDSKKDDPKRFTDPATTYRDFLRLYIRETRAKGATPVLVTSINRNAWEEGKLKDTLGGYPPATRDVAAETKTPLIDLHGLTRERFTALGEQQTTALFMNLDKGASPNYPDGSKDNTHLQERGAREVSQLAAQAISQLRIPLRKAAK